MRAILSFMVVVCSVVAVSKGAFAQGATQKESLSVAETAKLRSALLNEIDANLDSRRTLPLPAKSYAKIGSEKKALAISLLTQNDLTAIVVSLNQAIDNQLGGKAHRNLHRILNVLHILTDAAKESTSWTFYHSQAISAAYEKIRDAKNINFDLRMDLIMQFGHIISVNLTVKDLPANIFEGLSNLKRMDILPANLFEGMTQLKRVEIDTDKLNSLSIPDFQEMVHKILALKKDTKSLVIPGTILSDPDETQVVSLTSRDLFAHLTNAHVVFVESEKMDNLTDEEKQKLISGIEKLDPGTTIVNLPSDLLGTDDKCKNLMRIKKQ